MKCMFKILHRTTWLLLNLTICWIILVEDVCILTRTAALGTAAAPATGAAWGTCAWAWPAAGAWAWPGAAWVWGAPACCCWASCWAFCCSARACKHTQHVSYKKEIKELFKSDSTKTQSRRSWFRFLLTLRKNSVKLTCVGFVFNRLVRFFFFYFCTSKSNEHGNF